MGTKQHQSQSEFLLESIVKRAKREPFHYRQATKWVREDHPGTYTGATPHYNVHRDLSNSVRVEKVNHGTGMFRLVKRGSSIESRFDREHREGLETTTEGNARSGVVTQAHTNVVAGRSGWRAVAAARHPATHSERRLMFDGRHQPSLRRFKWLTTNENCRFRTSRTK